MVGQASALQHALPAPSKQKKTTEWLKLHQQIDPFLVQKDSDYYRGPGGDFSPKRTLPHSQRGFSTEEFLMMRKPAALRKVRTL